MPGSLDNNRAIPIVFAADADRGGGSFFFFDVASIKTEIVPRRVVNKK